MEGAQQVARTSKTAPQPTDGAAGLPLALSIPGLARAAGLSRNWLWTVVQEARDWESQTGNWPAWKVPKPDTGDPTTWDPARPDVQAWIKERTAPKRPAAIDDRDTLLRLYGTPDGAGGRPAHPKGQGRSIKAIAREVGYTASAVRARMLSLGIPVAEVPGTSRALQDVPLDALEAAYEASRGPSGRPSIERAAEALGVSHMTFRTELQVKRATKKAAEAPAPKRARKRS